MAVTRAQSAAVDGANPTATFGSTPASGSLLVATAMERSGLGTAALSISGSGWTKRIGHDTLLADGSFRHSLTRWTKTAGASEPTGVQVSGGTVRLVIEELAAGAGETFTFTEAISADSGANTIASQSTGTTGSTSGSQLLVAGLAGRQTTTPVDSASFNGGDVTTNNLQSGQGVSNGRHIVSAFAETTATGTKTATCTVADDGWQGATAGLMVFATSAGGGGTTYEKAGTVVAGTVTSGADVFEAVETAALIAGTYASAADIFEAVETGSVLAGTLLAGDQMAEISDIGSLIAGTQINGVDVAEFVEAGSVTAGALMAGGSQIPLAGIPGLPGQFAPQLVPKAWF